MIFFLLLLFTLPAYAANDERVELAFPSVQYKIKKENQEYWLYRTEAGVDKKILLRTEIYKDLQQQLSSVLWKDKYAKKSVPMQSACGKVISLKVDLDVHKFCAEQKGKLHSIQKIISVAESFDKAFSVHSGSGNEVHR